MAPYKTISQLREITEPHRPPAAPAQTTYGEVPAERQAAAAASDGVAASVRSRALPLLAP